MQDFLFVNFFLGHEKGEEARRILQVCDLLETAEADHTNRHSWLGEIHLGVSLRLPWNDQRLHVLLDRLREHGIEPFTRVDREYSRQELDQAEWLMLRVATAGLYGGVDYGQAYSFQNACETCGAGVEPIPPLIAEIGKMGKKDMDHLVFEGHLIASSRITDALAHLTGFEPTPVRSPRRSPDSRFYWLRIKSAFPGMNHSSLGIIKESVCSTCGRAGHYGTSMEPEMLTYNEVPDTVCDFNHTWEYFGDWQQIRNKSQTRSVGGSRGIVVSQRTRRALLQLKVRRLVWVPVTILQTA